MKNVASYSIAGIGKAAPARYPGLWWGRRFRMALALRIVAVTLRFAPACSADDVGGSSGGGYFASWFDRVSKTQAEQPHWVTPLATVSPRLEQEYRYEFWQSRSQNRSFNSYGTGKGLELIPFDIQGTTGIAPLVYLEGHWYGGENEEAADAILDALAAGGSADAYRIV